VALAGNVVRNTVLVAIESGLLRAPAWAHDAVGLAVLAAVCAAAVGLMGHIGLESGGRHAAR
jgi:exosortase/archaeosortase family protein